MTIYWEFINIPRGSEFFRVSLAPSLPDHKFQFNLAVHTPGDSTWLTAAPNFVSGFQAHDLHIEGHRNQEFFLLIQSSGGGEKRMRFLPDEIWVEEGDIGAIQTVPEYRLAFK